MREERSLRGAVERSVLLRNGLKTHVSRLRTALDRARSRLRHEPGGYRLVVDPGELDVHRVQTLLRRARTAGAPR
jgi:hypothetical protein